MLLLLLQVALLLLALVATAAIRVVVLIITLPLDQVIGTVQTLPVDSKILHLVKVALDVTHLILISNSNNSNNNPHSSIGDKSQIGHTVYKLIQ
jgi:hypothetical protein